MTSAAPNFELFGQAHLLTVLTIAAAAAGAYFIGRRLSSRGETPALVRPLGWLVIAVELARLTIEWSLLGAPWQEALPLHLCRIAALMSGWLLIRPSYRWFEVTYFFVLAAGLNALLTPEMAVGFPSPSYLLYFVAHGLPWVATLLAAGLNGYRPTFVSIHKAMLAMIVLALVVATPVNLLIGSNYFYLCQKPAGLNAVEGMGEWPTYLLGLVTAAWVSSILVWLPWPLADLLRRLLVSSRP